MRASSAIIPTLVAAAVLSTSAVKPVEYVRISPASTGPGAQRQILTPALSCERSVLRWSDEQLRPLWPAGPVDGRVCGGGAETALWHRSAER